MIPPTNLGLSDPKAAIHSISNERWQYMSTFHLQTDEPRPYGLSLLHQFRHRQHPATGQRLVRNIPASIAYFYNLYTPQQPNRLLLIEWLNALRGNYIQQCIRVYGSDNHYCASGLLFHIAGLISTDGAIDFSVFEQALRENHSSIGKMICWLLDLPYTVALNTHFQSIQNRNDLPTPFPELADLLLIHPAVKQRYDEIITAHPYLSPDWHNNTTAFDAWMQEVDLILINRIGFSSEDITDQCWAEHHEDGLTPTEAADAALEELEYN